MNAPHGFTLVEAMVALLISGIVVASAVTTYRVGLAQNTDQRREWNAFTIAQSQMEMLSATSTAALVDLVSDGLAPADIGTAADANCSTGVDGSKSGSMLVDELGNPSAVDTPYVLCWKITGGSPSGNLINLRVVSGYRDDFGNRKFIILQNIISGGV